MANIDKIDKIKVVYEGPLHEHTAGMPEFDLAEYCPICGEKLKKDKEYSDFECSHCKTKLPDMLIRDKRMIYCPTCGEEFLNKDKIKT